jgi:hypothetical protein
MNCQRELHRPMHLNLDGNVFVIRDREKIIPVLRFAKVPAQDDPETAGILLCGKPRHEDDRPVSFPPAA